MRSNSTDDQRDSLCETTEDIIGMLDSHRHLEEGRKAARTCVVSGE